MEDEKWKFLRIYFFPPILQEGLQVEQTKFEIKNNLFRIFFIVSKK
jgi:hypothetical protein